MPLTRREAAIAYNSQAPLEMTLQSVPQKRITNPDAPKEWKLQAACIKEIRALQNINKNLRYIAAGAAQSKLRPAQAGFAKMMGFQRGIPDIILILNRPLKVTLVELKLPGGRLTPEQADWFSFWRQAGISCVQIEDVRSFARHLDQFCGAV